MRKSLAIVFVLILTGAGFYYWKRHGAVVDPNTSSYKNSGLGISFSYPKILSVSETNDVILIHHEVPFEHKDFCDFRGEATTTEETLTDFNVNIHTDDLGIVDALKKEAPYIPQDNFENGEVIPSEGFIDAYNLKNMTGYKVTEGAEGCGQTIYFLKLSQNKTLVINRDIITIFSGAIDQEKMQEALFVPEIISKESENQIFDSILKSLKA